MTDKRKSMGTRPADRSARLTRWAISKQDDLLKREFGPQAKPEPEPPILSRCYVCGVDAGQLCQNIYTGQPMEKLHPVRGQKQSGGRNKWRRKRQRAREAYSRNGERATDSGSTTG
jgi:hypothetical protein